MMDVLDLVVMPVDLSYTAQEVWDKLEEWKHVKAELNAMDKEDPEFEEMAKE
ncbi:hypothetical protein EWM64_g6625 [Hericium alpestre]|uniref:Uncharacterized protein n=1 Tax=Hericium alpestre TaxID=135208 RepID=A0A4Y9ZV47_9AGAM|nr:hypothetical protein EWM64_g6625 [Hericium alpestre]